MARLDPEVKQLADQVDALEKRLDRLRSLYEQYFQGIEKIEPSMERTAVKNLIQVGPRQLMPEAGPEERLDPNREIELGLSEEQARAEAQRCLNCGLICYYRTKYH